ncbi:MAG: hypothetical protein ACE5JU_19820 [Candidatus Binatia bacterium]
MRKIKLSRRMVAILKKQKREFRRKFGRDPGPNDHVFFDPDADVPTLISKEKFDNAVLKAARKAGFSEEQIRGVCLQFEIDYDEHRSDA